jgi:hypothetical protein
LKYIGDSRHGIIGSIIEATVKSVGNKYITTIDGDWNTERKFEIENDFREYYTIGGSDYQLYLSKQQIEEENEVLEIGKLIRSQFINSYSDMTKLSIDKLRKIKVIIDEIQCE